ncbi:hypothetical protein E8E13_003871 [Curvularia kusanoi]|uniref:Uncharacterized protein n=1 Tax=Curvularia kusanoi TaxID=90978 RepID=A0A9P4T597_CURKU|nr:hypothetical protein E8E13_003871 [Curvularia kusanoi]
MDASKNSAPKPPESDFRSSQHKQQFESDAQSDSQDAQVLSAMGHVEELPRQFNNWSMLALAFSVLGTWSTLAQNMASGLTSGGPISILWGLVLVTACNLCICVSLGELTSSMPTALGQAYWIHRLWTTPTGRFTAFMTDFILATKVLHSENWPGAGYGWLQFVVYVTLTASLTVVNITACRKTRILPWINNFVGIMFMLLFITFIMAFLISVSTKHSHHYQSAGFVFGQWINGTGWSNGVVWFIGLVQSAYGLTAFDACIHMVEELPSPSRAAPRILWLSVLIGAITGFFFMLVCLFCIQDLESITSADLPFVELCVQTTGLTGATILLALFIFNGFGQNISIMTTASRLTWGFARDGGLPFNKYMAVVNDQWHVPVRALWIQGLLISAIGLLYLFANTVLQAILSVSTIALTISYALPIAVLLFVGRDKMSPGPFQLGKWGYTANVVSLIYCSITTVFFFFPTDPNPAPADMNWAIAVFGIMLLIAIGFWFLQGRRSYLRTEDTLVRIVSGQAVEEYGSVTGAAKDSLMQTHKFRDPSIEFRPKFRYWLPDASVQSELVVRDIHEAKAIGAGGLEFLPFYAYGAGDESYKRNMATNPNQPFVEPNFPDWDIYGFGTPTYVGLFKDALIAAKDAGILLDLPVGANQGQGVPAVPGTAGLAMQLLMGHVTISPGGIASGPVPKAQQPIDAIQSGLQFMHPLEDYQTPNLVVVLAYQLLPGASNSSSLIQYTSLNRTSFIDLSSLITAEGTLQWSPPDASKSWKVFSFWESYTNQRSCDGGPNPTTIIGNGSWIVDHFSKRGASRITDFWDEIFLSDPEIADLVKTVGKYAWEDSMEQLAALPWTPGLLARFKASYGYDMTSYLPVIFSSLNTWGGFAPPYAEAFFFNDDSAETQRLYSLDYQRVLNDGYQDYIAQFQDWTKSIGIRYSNQPAYNLPLQMSSDVPFIDAPEAESLGFKDNVDMYRQFSGPAHFYNKSVISTEVGAVQEGAYLLTIPDLLRLIKRSFAGGFTMSVIHGFPTFTPYPNTTWPGYTAFYYQFTEMWNQVQPSWMHMRDTLDYVGRNQWALQQGTPQIDLAFYVYDSPWLPLSQYNSTNLEKLGYTYDYIGADNIASDHARVVDGRLGVPGYKTLIFNNQSVISNNASEALVQLASNGLPLIFIGSAPYRAYPSQDQSKVDATMARVLSSPGVHHLDTIDQLPGLLQDIRITPRVYLNCSSSPVYPVYRASVSADYVFFFNDQKADVDCTATISIQDVDPYELNAWTGDEIPAPAIRNNSTLSMRVSLKAEETRLFALRRSLSPSFYSDTPQIFHATDDIPANLTTWNLTIEDWHSAPDRFACPASDITQQASAFLHQ